MLEMILIITISYLHSYMFYNYEFENINFVWSYPRLVWVGSSYAQKLGQF